METPVALHHFHYFLALNVVFDHDWCNLIPLSDYKKKKQMAKSALLI